MPPTTFATCAGFIPERVSRCGRLPTPDDHKLGNASLARMSGAGSDVSCDQRVGNLDRRACLRKDRTNRTLQALNAAH